MTPDHRKSWHHKWVSFSSFRMFFPCPVRIKLLYQKHGPLHVVKLNMKGGRVDSALLRLRWLMPSVLCDRGNHGQPPISLSCVLFHMLCSRCRALPYHSRSGRCSARPRRRCRSRTGWGSQSWCGLPSSSPVRLWPSPATTANSK